MTNLKIIVIDTNNKNKEVSLDELTSTGAEMLIPDCKKFLYELENISRMG